MPFEGGLSNSLWARPETRHDPKHGTHKIFWAMPARHEHKGCAVSRISARRATWPGPHFGRRHVGVRWSLISRVSVVVKRLYCLSPHHKSFHLVRRKGDGACGTVEGYVNFDVKFIKPALLMLDQIMISGHTTTCLCGSDRIDGSSYWNAWYIATMAGSVVAC